MNIGERIKFRREEIGLTLQDVADKLNVSRPTVQRYESGDIKTLKQGTIEKLSVILNVSPGYLMGWFDEHGEPTKKHQENKTFIIELLETMVKQGMIKDSNNIDDKTMKMIVDAVRFEADKILKAGN